MTSIDPTRRALLRAALLSALPMLLAGCGSAARARSASAQSRVAALERASGGRLGVCMLDAGSGRSAGWRADERFGMCSTFKLLLAAAVLREADAGRLRLDRVVRYTSADLVPHAPVTERHLAAGGMRIDALAEAAQVTSDNVAANLLIRELGGPAGVTALWRAMGDDATRIDRYEPAMNFVPAGELRDTTTPRAMAGSVARVFAGDLLSAASCERLRQWTIATRTGLRRLRAGLPADWIAGDKTGTGYREGMPNKHNDVAIVWRPDRAPLVVAAYFDARDHFDAPRAEDDAVLAEVGRIAADWIDAG